MHICLLVNQDIASNYALNLLLPQLAKNHKLWVFASSRVGDNNDKPEALKLLQFFEQELFNQLLFPILQSEGAATAKRKSFSQLNTYLAAAYSELNDINSATSIQMLQGLELDLILSVRYGRILQPSVIQLPKLGVLNLHSGLLPQYRGVMATFYAMLNNEKQIGTSLHYIQDAGIDTGDLVSLNSINTDYSQSYLTNVLNLYPKGCAAILETVEQLRQGQTLPVLPKEGKGHYYSFPELQHIQQFSQQGFKLVDIAFMQDLAKQFM